MAERSKALIHLSWSGVAWVRIPLGTYIFILNFSLPVRSEQLSGAHANEIKHGYSPVVIVVLDPRYDWSYKALYTYSRSIAFNPDGGIYMCKAENITFLFVRGINSFHIFPLEIT